MTELPRERPASLDEAGHRLSMHPAAVFGYWKTRKTLFQNLLALVLLVLPWIKINGAPSILLDIPNRRFALMGIVFWAHDTPLLFLVFGTFAFAAALSTALLGRIWCGWACPQTVFIERMFRAIEIFVEGSHLKRRALDAASWSFRKIWKRTLKWSLFLCCSLLITHSLLAYFVGVERLYEMVQAPPSESWNIFLMMVTVTSIILFNFGWFREQFCIIVCPYGKIQSLLTDERTLNVAYDNFRGEPKRAGGDCIDCSKCVSACPTGIDIRRGSQQLECINCTACIDACDDVMSRIKKPTGLIRYASDREIKDRENQSFKRSLRRPRVVLYLFLLLVCLTGLGWTIMNREYIQVVALRANETPYQIVVDESGRQLIINHFKVDVRNQSFESVKFRVLDSDIESVEFVTASRDFAVAGGSSYRMDIFIKFPAGKALKHAMLSLQAQAESGLISKDTQLNLISPSDLGGN